MSDMGDQWAGFGQVELKVEPTKIFVLSAFWYGLPGKGQPVTLGTFTSELLAQSYLDKFRELDTPDEYGEYHIFEEKLNPTIS